MIPIAGSVCPKMAAPISTITQVLVPCDSATPPSSGKLKSPSPCIWYGFPNSVIAVETSEKSDAECFPRLGKRKSCSPASVFWNPHFSLWGCFLSEFPQLLWETSVTWREGEVLQSTVSAEPTSMLRQHRHQTC